MACGRSNEFFESDSASWEARLDQQGVNGIVIEVLGRKCQSCHTHYGPLSSTIIPG